MTDSTLSDWLERLQSQHPVEIDLGLERVSAVAQAMHLVPASMPTLTVAGTNGKGSVVAVLSSVLLAGGLRVGSYTSPHLVSFNERICVNGSPVSDQDLLAAFNTIEAARGDISLTYFEVATLAALWIFREHKVDVQVLEVGLGGRLDAVNIIDADLTIITSIGLDHMDWLGDDRGLIAVEKAGVARPGRPCVVAEHDPPASLRRRLEDIGAEVSWISEDWILESPHVVTSSGSRYSLPESEGLLPQNVGAAVEALGVVRGDFSHAVFVGFDALHWRARQAQQASIPECRCADGRGSQRGVRAGIGPATSFLSCDRQDASDLWSDG